MQITPINIIFVIAIFIATVFVAWKEGIYDAGHKKQIKHKRDFRIRVIAGVVSGLIFHILILWKLGFVAIMVSSALLLVAQAFVYWIAFELSYNKADGQDNFYIGKEADTDKTARKLNISGIAYFIIKLIGFLMFSAFYYLWVYGDHWSI